MPSKSPTVKPQNLRQSQERAEKMAALYRQGQTFQEIALAYGVSHQRIQQIITKYCGRIGKDGGKAKQIANRKKANRRKRNIAHIKEYGCSYREFKNLSVSIKRAYISQKMNARRRGVDWEITLWDWWKFWRESGKWSKRGRGQGYVMCRFQDEGAYKIGNIYIELSTHNVGFAPKIKKNTLPLGATKMLSGKYLSLRMINGKRYYLGVFTTPGDAHQAYINKGLEIKGHEDGL